MKKVLLTVVLICVASTAWAGNLMLVEFSTDSYDTTLVWLTQLEERGVTARHIFPPSAAIVEAYNLSSAWLEQQQASVSVYTVSDLQGESTLGTAGTARSAFLHLSAESPPPPGGDLIIHEPPIEDPPGQKTAPETSLTSRLTGQYMIGYIAVGIYLMESTGSQENWWPDAEQQTFNEIVQGLDWLAEQGFQRGARVVWVYPPVETISTGYEPINDQHVPYTSLGNWKFRWLDDIYNAHGVSSEWDGAYQLANQLRHNYHTNWAVEIAVVMDENDSDHQFSDGYCAYASHYSNSSDGRSPIVVMTYNNGNYGPLRMDYIVAHETSHTFGTSDEYWNEERPASDCNWITDCGPHRSYLQTNNGNCEFCNPNSVACYMKQQTWPLAMCSYTPPELGWRDYYLPNNDVMDPVDQYSGSYMWIQPVAAGDRIVIKNYGLDLMNVIAVSQDMLCGSSNNAILWEGAMWNNTLAPTGLYAWARNGAEQGSLFLYVSSQPVYTIPSHSYSLDVVSYQNVNAALAIRHTIYDSLGNVYSRPRFDVWTNQNVSFQVDILGYEDGIYTSEVYGHRSDGFRTNLSSITFINYICGDTNNDGDVTVADISLLIELLFIGGGAPPVHPASGDVNCTGDLTIGDISVLIDHLFISGAELNCCHSLP